MTGHTEPKKKKKRGIMGVFLLLPSLLSTVISHHGTPSRWIPSSLRQFHSPLSLSLSLNLSTRSLSSAAGMKLTLFFPALRAEFLWRCRHDVRPTASLLPTALHDLVRVPTLSSETRQRAPNHSRTHKHRFPQGDLQAPNK